MAYYLYYRTPKNQTDQLCVLRVVKDFIFSFHICLRLLSVVWVAYHHNGNLTATLKAHLVKCIKYKYW